MDSPNAILATKLTSISTAFVTSGAILSLSYSSAPILAAGSPKFSIPQINALFSSGSHVFPQLATLATAGFAYLAYLAPYSSNTQLRYVAAAVVTIGIAPFTMLVMLPTNMTLRSIEPTDEGVKKAGGDDRVRALIQKFKSLNAARGLIMAAGAGLGLWAALTE